MTAERTRPTSTWNSPAASYYLLLAATSILLLVGLAVVLSSSSVFSIRQEDGNPWTLFLIQVAALAVGLAALALGSRQSVRWWKRMTPLVLAAAVVLLVVVIGAGVSSGGNRNWVRIGSVTLQPSEIAKLGIALYLGMVLSTFRRELTNFKRIMVPGGVAAGVVLTLILAGRDMGTAVVLCIIVAAAYWVAGLPLRFFAVGAAFLVAGGLALIAQGTTRSERISVWLNPSTCDIQDNCLQTTHGTWALASGGLWGLGPGMSR
ncbi:MAG: cell division protein FtsW, partial [Actinobacteria bacterium HGW-Actinobacteria-8]